MVRKERKPPEKIVCRFHDAQGKTCICIRPVKTDIELAVRLHNQKVLKERFGIEV